MSSTLRHIMNEVTFVFCTALAADVLVAVRWLPRHVMFVLCYASAAGVCVSVLSALLWCRCASAVGKALRAAEYDLAQSPDAETGTGLSGPLLMGLVYAKSPPTVTPSPAETREEYLNRGQHLIWDHIRPLLEADRISRASYGHVFHRAAFLFGRQNNMDHFLAAHGLLSPRVVSWAAGVGLAALLPAAVVGGWCVVPLQAMLALLGAVMGQLFFGWCRFVKVDDSELV